MKARALFTAIGTFAIVTASHAAPGQPSGSAMEDSVTCLTTASMTVSTRMQSSQGKTASLPNMSSSAVTSASTSCSTTSSGQFGSSTTRQSEISSGTIPLEAANSSALVTSSTTLPASTATATGTCSVNGELLCNGPNQFGLCNWGRVVWQDVSLGTSCIEGQIVYASSGMVDTTSMNSTPCPSSSALTLPGPSPSSPMQSGSPGPSASPVNSPTFDSVPFAPFAGGQGEAIIQDHYVIHFQTNHTFEAHCATTGHNFTTCPAFHWLEFLPGYSAILEDERLLNAIRQDPGVVLIENNVQHSIPETFNSSAAFERNQSSNATSITKRDYSTITDTETYANRVMMSSGVKLPTPVAPGDYVRVHDAGRGVNVYVLDTGIRVTHKLFSGRASHFQGHSTSPYIQPLEPMDDVQGHGTHVAGTVAGDWVGIVPSAKIINVKVLGMKGGDDVNIARAIHDIIGEHNNNKKNHVSDWDFRGSVINMSFASPSRTTILSNAVDAAKAAGIFLVAAAGNKNVEASNFFPCSYATVHCVGATDYKYAKADFSNYGRGLSSVAPGVDIVSASNLDDNSVRRDSGTSMAAPHVAGTAAIFVMWEALGNDADTTSVRMNQNSHDSWVDGFYQALNPFTTTGILDSRRSWRGPYVAAPYWPVRHVFSADTDLETTYDTGVSTTATSPPEPTNPAGDPPPGGDDLTFSEVPATSAAPPPSPSPPAPTPSFSFSGNCHLNASKGKWQVGFRIDALQDPTKCGIATLNTFNCLESKGCAATDWTHVTCDDNGPGVGGTFDTIKSAPCGPGAISDCFGQGFGWSVPCNQG